MSLANAIVIVAVLAIAFLASLVLTPLVRVVALRMDAVSRPDGRRRLHRRPTPVWGGSAVYAALMISIAIGYCLLLERTKVVSFPEAINSLPAALALSAGLLCLLGCYDDLRDMHARWKLLGQILSTLPIVLVGCSVHHVVVFGHTIELGWLGIPLTMGWVILGINALNLIDGMDGLASTIGICVCLVVTAIAFSQGLVGESLSAMALAGALAGFLVYNLPPAKIYLGDCGSMTLGLALAFLTLRVSLVAPDTATVNLSVLLILLFVPLLDTGLAILRRKANGQSFMAADRGHIHHRLLDRGLSIPSTLTFLAGVSLTAGLLAWAVVLGGQALLAWTLLAVLLGLAIRFRLLAHEEWRLTRRLLVRAVTRLAGQPITTTHPPRLMEVRPPHRPPPDGRPTIPATETAGPNPIHAEAAAEEVATLPVQTKTAA